MQTTDKLSSPFFFKLLILFALLLSGAMLKTTGLEPTSKNKATRNTEPVTPPDEEIDVNHKPDQYSLSPANSNFSTIAM